MRMKHHTVRILVVAASLGTAAACGPGATSEAEIEKDPTPAPVSKSWLRGTTDERFETVTRHLRGLDMAMVEIGYRYQELYWAGVESNWEYADYQLTKLRLSLANALERRPKRRASAEKLFLPLLDDMKRAVVGKERARFEENFARLTAACNSCHSAESVASFRVDVPTERPSPIRAPR